MEIIEELLDTAKEQYKAGDREVALETMLAAVKLLRAGIAARQKLSQVS